MSAEKSDLTKKLEAIGRSFKKSSSESCVPHYYEREYIGDLIILHQKEKPHDQ